jgi:hypothetical protein
MIGRCRTVDQGFRAKQIATYIVGSCEIPYLLLAKREVGLLASNLALFTRFSRVLLTNRSTILWLRMISHLQSYAFHQVSASNNMCRHSFFIRRSSPLTCISGHEGGIQLLPTRHLYALFNCCSIECTIRSCSTK